MFTNMGVTRKCVECRRSFDQNPGEKSVRCQDCREKKRCKTCRKCGASYQDDSDKNTRRYCDQCSEKGLPRPNKVSDRIQRERAQRVVRKNGGRADRIETMKPFTRSWWGRAAEVLFVHLYPSATDMVALYGNRCTYDCDLPGYGRVNVKSAKQCPTKYGRKSWGFQLEGSENCDKLFLVGFDQDQTMVEKAWFVSTKDVGRRLVKMSPSSRDYAYASSEIQDRDLDLMNRKFQALLQDIQARSDQNPSQDPTTQPPAQDFMIVGKMGEIIYSKIHQEASWIASRDPNARWDFTDADGTRVNVKVRRPAKDRPRWTFIRGEYSSADVYQFYALDASANTILASFRVPQYAIEKGFSVALEGTSKWHQYKEEGWPRPVSDFVEISDLESIHTEIHGLNERVLKDMSSGEVESLLCRALRYYRMMGFPYPKIPDDKRMAAAIRRIRAYTPNGKIFAQEMGGLALCSAYMPNRFDVRNAQADFSAVGAFHDDGRLLQALRFSIRGSRPKLTPSRVRNSLTALCRTPVQFSPAVSHALVSHFSTPGSLVLDPCAGWGGRMLGTLVAGRRYIGVEPAIQTSHNLYHLGSRISEYGICGRETWTILPGGIETANLDGVEADFAFTSPPYAGQEAYEGFQWGDFSAWKAGFLPLMFEKVRKHLKPDSVFAVNISDVTRSGKKLPLETSTIEVAKSSGFKLEDSWRMLQGSFGKQKPDRHEPIFIFRRL